METATLAVQAYHLDLAQRLVTGKSPAMEAAPAARTQPIDPATVTPEQAAEIAQRELDAIARFVAGPQGAIGGGVGVVVTRSS